MMLLAFSGLKWAAWLMTKDALHLFLKKFIEKVLIKGKIIADKPPLRQLSAVRNFKVSPSFSARKKKIGIGSKPFDEGCGGFIFP